MRITAAILTILCATVSAQGGTVSSSKVVCSGKPAPAGAPVGGMLVWGAGVGEVATRIPPGFKVKKIYCEMHDPLYGRRACKYSKKAEKSCPSVVSKAMLIDDFGDGFKDLSWYIESPDVGRPRTFVLSAEVVPDAPKK